MKGFETRGMPSAHLTAGQGAVFGGAQRVVPPPAELRCCPMLLQ
jgi:hypothetical protein